ncbi:hypothetical protein ACTXT7_012678 [Hymenolepis weldensis]
MEEVLQNFLLGYRSTSHPALGEKSPAELLIGRKLRTVHESMQTKTLPDRKRGIQKNEFAVNTPVCALDYRLSRQWTWHGSIIYDVKAGKDTWVPYHIQLRRRLAEPTIDRHYLSLCLLLDTFNPIHILPPSSQVIDQVMVLSRAARTRTKPSRPQVDPSSNTYG